MDDLKVQVDDQVSELSLGLRDSIANNAHQIEAAVEQAKEHIGKLTVAMSEQSQNGECDGKFWQKQKI